MFSKLENIREMIEEATTQFIPFPQFDNQGKKPIAIFQSDLILPSIYPFRSSQEIQNNIPNIHPQIYSIPTYTIKNTSISLDNQWPKSCVGLVLCEHHQNNDTYYVYGTGILIHSNIVLTSAQNVYCRRLNTEYINIRFITGINGNKYSGIYDSMRTHYPKEYTIQEGYQQYDFAVLQLYDDLSDSCGYVGWKSDYKVEDKADINIYGYMRDNNQGYFDLRKIQKCQKLKQNNEQCLCSAELWKDGNQQYIVGLYMQSIRRFYVLTEKIWNTVNEWTTKIKVEIQYQDLSESIDEIIKQTASNLRQIILKSNNINAEGCKYLNQADWPNLTNINLKSNNINSEGCKYLSQVKWKHLTHIELWDNNIGASGCKYLSQANWNHLTNISLRSNNIDAQGCKYLSQANWIHLTNIDLSYNQINALGCKYLRQCKWLHLTKINFYYNNIGVQGCKYLSQINWKHLNTINLYYNNIGSQGCKYLSQANWTKLTNIDLCFNYIDEQGCKYLVQSKWKHLSNIILWENNIGIQGCKYLSQAQWKLQFLGLNFSQVIIDRVVLNEVWPILKF